MRIIAGRFRGRRISAPPGAATRPTSDRVREAIFSSLGPIHGARVLDVYAGTGALGIEALSRGAVSAVFVEAAAAALRSIRDNLRVLGLDAVVIGARVPPALERACREGPFDLVFLDPPYADVLDAAAAMASLLRAGALVGGARLVLEHASRDDTPLVDGLDLELVKIYGDTSVARYVVGPTG